MEPSPKTIFYLLSDLSHALSDLSKAMDKWHMELEQSILNADCQSVLVAAQEIQVILEKAKHNQK